MISANDFSIERLSGNDKFFQIVSIGMLTLSFFVSFLFLNLVFELSGKVIGQIAINLLIISYIPVILLLFLYFFDFLFDFLSFQSKFLIYKAHFIILSISVGIVMVHFLRLYEQAPLNSLSLIGLFSIWLLEFTIYSNDKHFSNHIMEGVLYLLISGFIFGISFHANIGNIALIIFFSFIFTLLTFKMVSMKFFRKNNNGQSINNV